MKAIVLLSAVVCFPAFAGSSGLGFVDIKDACQNPSRYQNQIAPSNVQVTCEERISHWVPNAARDMELPLLRQITSSLTSDKYQVSPTIHQMDVGIQKASCPSFKEVLELTSFTKATSCDEMIAFKGGEEEFCADILDKAREANPKMVNAEDTGRVVEFCTQGISNQGKGQGQGQQGKGQGQGQQGKGQQGKGQGNRK